MRKWACIVSTVLIANVGWAERPDLHGRVVSSDETGIEGATVYIWTASVKVGTSTYCPSCYPDCGKRAVVDVEGRFSIPSLDPSLRFKVLAVAEGFVPTFLEKVDPANGEIMFVLGEISPERLEPVHRVDGRVIDSEGKPIMGATIDVFGIKTERGSRYGGMQDFGVDPLAVTNARGEFMVTSETTDATFYAKVSARDFATQIVHTLATGADVHEIVMQHGVTVAGHIRNKGEGLPGVEVGMVPVDRNSHTFTGEYTVGTFDSGFFEIPNVPAQTEFYVYGIMESLQGLGAVPVRKVVTGANGDRLDFGTLNVERGFSISGRVVLSDEGAIPPNTRLSISRDDAWDSLFCTLDENGAFAASNLPSGEYGIYVRVQGYRMSAENHSLDPLNQNGLMGVIIGNVEGLTILLEPGQANPNDHAPDAGEQYQRLQHEPIRGIEAD